MRRRMVTLVVVLAAAYLGLCVLLFPLFPVRWLLRDKYESWRCAAHVSAPTLLVAAEHDDVIPRSSTESLHKRFRAGVATLKIIAATSHNTIAECAEHTPLLRGTP